MLERGPVPRPLPISLPAGPDQGQSGRGRGRPAHTQPVPVQLGPQPDLRRRLGLVQVGLAALVADLESVGAVEEELRPLRDLAAELAPSTRPTVAGQPELDRLRDRALAVLRAFAAAGPVPSPPAGPVPPRDPGFWKR
jgi:hypothetical protein